MLKIIKPINNENYCLVSKSVRSFYDHYKKQQKLVKNDFKLNGLDFGIEDKMKADLYYKKSESIYIARPVTFEFKNLKKARLILSKDKNFKNIHISKILKVNKIDIYNLERNKTYYWKIIDLINKKESNIRIFRTLDYPRAMLFGKLSNVRDFGGYLTKDNKRIKQGLLFRGAEIVDKTYIVGGKLKENQQTQTHVKSITNKDKVELKKFLNNGIEIDCRGDDESNFATKSCLNFVKYYRYGIPAYDNTFLRKDLFKNIRKIFELIANADKNPIYLHCWGGADRTGTICFMLGALLGMSQTDLFVDYELTTFSGNKRVHYKPDPKYVWLRFIEFYQWIMQYAKDNHLSYEINEVMEDIFLNIFKIKQDTIDKIKDIFLD